MQPKFPSHVHQETEHNDNAGEDHEFRKSLTKTPNDKPSKLVIQSTAAKTPEDLRKSKTRERMRWTPFDQTQDKEKHRSPYDRFSNVNPEDESVPDEDETEDGWVIPQNEESPHVKMDQEDTIDDRENHKYDEFWNKKFRETNNNHFSAEKDESHRKRYRSKEPSSRLKEVLEQSEQRINHFHQHKDKSPNRKPDQTPYSNFKEVE